VEPAELVDIFRRNIVIVRGQLIAGDKGVSDYVTVSDWANYTGSLSAFGETQGVNVKVIQQAGKDDPGAFPTWICNYAKNQIHYQTLTSDRRFCFTPTMNGCTFGIGIPSDGALIVSHANNFQEDSPDSHKQLDTQSKIQSGMTQKGMKTGALFGPEQYSFGPNRLVSMTFFGVYDGEWKFYYQQYQALGGNRFRIVTFQQVTRNQVQGF
jgi:hypothetical protein